MSTAVYVDIVAAVVAAVLADVVADIVASVVAAHFLNFHNIVAFV